MLDKGFGTFDEAVTEVSGGAAIMLGNFAGLGGDAIQSQVIREDLLRVGLWINKNFEFNTIFKPSKKGFLRIRFSRGHPCTASRVIAARYSKLRSAS